MQCHRCKHLTNESDPSVGLNLPDSCDVAGALYLDGECSEQVSLLLEDMLMSLATMDRCPRFADASQTPRTWRSAWEWQPEVQP